MVSTTKFTNFTSENTMKCIWTIQDIDVYKGERITSSIYCAKNLNGDAPAWYVAFEHPKFSVHFPHINQSLNAKTISTFMTAEGKQITGLIKMDISLHPSQTEQKFGLVSLTLNEILFMLKHYRSESNELCIETQLMIKPHTSNPNKHQMSSNIRTLYRDFERLFNTKESSDIILIVDDKEFPAHKVVLSTRSPVFVKMFQHPMLEQKENRVDITDIKPDVFEEVLRFIYTDEVQKIDEIATELMEAAEKYQLDGLKDQCERVLQNNITIDNAAETYIYAERYNANLLMSYILDFIAFNKKEVVITSGFKAMEKSHPDLTIKLFHEILSRMM